MISPNHNIIKYCEEIGLKYFEINQFKNKDLLYKKNIILSEVDKINKIIDGELYFSHTQWDIFCFLMVDKLKTKKNIYFLNFESEYNLSSFKISLNYLKIWVQKKILAFNFGFELEIKEIGGKYLLGITKDFFKDSGIQIIDNKLTYKNEIINTVKKYSISEDRIRNLYIDDGVNFYKEHLDLLDNTELINILNDNKFYFKGHPTSNSSNFYFAKCISLKTEMPVEFYLPNVSNIVISVISSSLITASYFEDIKTISLLELVKWNSESYKEKMKKYLQSESTGRILFPNTVDDLKRLLKF